MRDSFAMVLLAAVVGGCSGKSDDDSGASSDTGMSSADTVVCAARSQSGIEMVPGTGPDSTAPAIMEVGTPYTVLLTADAGGWVRLALPEAGSYQVHTGFAGVFRGLWGDTGERALPPPRASEVCPEEVPEVFTIAVTEPVTYYMQLGPLASMNFWVYLQLEG